MHNPPAMWKRPRHGWGKKSEPDRGGSPKRLNTKGLAKTPRLDTTPPSRVILKRRGSKRMSFCREAAQENIEALGRFSLASMRYKQACSRYTKIRLATVAQAAPSTEAIVIHHREHALYKKACREYAEARVEWISSIQAAALRIPGASNESVYSTSLETNDRAITEQLRRESLLASITSEEIELQKSVLAARMQAKEQAQAQGSIKDAVLAQREDDPMFGDFSPL